MKLKKIRVAMLTLIVASTLSAAFNVTTVSAEMPFVTVYHSRECSYYAKPFEDSVSNVELNGLHERAFTIRPEPVAELHNAKIVMETPYSEDPYFPHIGWEPSADFTVTLTEGIYRYEWAFHDPVKSFEQASAWFDINLPVTFKPEFDSQRTIDPILIASPSETQMVTIRATPSIYFYWFTVHSVLMETDEVTPSFVVGSASPDFLEVEQSDWVYWIIPYSIEVGKEYTFSVQINVENKRYPQPVLFKPDFRIMGWVTEEQSAFPSTESVMVDDDVLNGPVTYSGVGPTGELCDWQIVDCNLNRVVFTTYSSSVPVSATIDIDPDTLNLKSNGAFVTAYVELPDGYNVADIVLDTVCLDGIQAITDPQYDFVTDPNAYLVDHDGDGILERMVKFDRDTVRDALTGMPDCEEGNKFYDLPLTVTGKVAGILFEGTDTIAVLKK